MNAADVVWLLTATAVALAWLTFCYGADLRSRRSRHGR